MGGIVQMVEILKNVNMLIRGFGYLFSQFAESTPERKRTGKAINKCIAKRNLKD